MINQAKMAIDLEELIPGLDPVPEDDETFKNNEELFIEEQKNRNQIPEKLTKNHFETLNYSVLPF